MVSQVFDGLLDDAALFPPGNAAMPAAVAEHHRRLDEPAAALLGPFVCSAARVPELAAEQARFTRELPVSLVVRGEAEELRAGVDAVLGAAGLLLDAVEFAPAAEMTAAAAAHALSSHLPPEATGYLELPWTSDQNTRIAALADTPHRVKLRTGGTDSAAYPSAAQLAAAIHGCMRRGLGFKCTAGLHHAVRNTDPATGFEQHGFLNVLLAVDVATESATAAEHLLAERDGPRLAARLRELPAPRRAQLRRHFRSFGTCSIDEPITDLVDLGLLPALP
jgi:hypothetical protein